MDPSAWIAFAGLLLAGLVALVTGANWVAKEARMYTDIKIGEESKARHDLRGEMTVILSGMQAHTREVEKTAIQLSIEMVRKADLREFEDRMVAFIDGRVEDLKDRIAHPRG